MIQWGSLSFSCCCIRMTTPTHIVFSHFGKMTHCTHMGVYLFQMVFPIFDTDINITKLTGFFPFFAFFASVPFRFSSHITSISNALIIRKLPTYNSRHIAWIFPFRLFIFARNNLGLRRGKKRRKILIIY